MKLRFLYAPLLALCTLSGLGAQAPAPAPAHAQSTTRSLDEAVPDENGIHRVAVLRALDKITGRAINIDAPAGIPIQFGTMTITLRYCHTVPPEEPPETTAFLQIDDNESGTPMRIFSGWMFASTPALNALEHGVYDVWVITCRTDEPPPEPVVFGPDGSFVAPGPEAPPSE